MKTMNEENALNIKNIVLRGLCLNVYEQFIEFYEKDKFKVIKK